MRIFDGRKFIILPIKHMQYQQPTKERRKKSTSFKSFSQTNRQPKPSSIEFSIMGRKLDALLGRNRYLKPSKFKTLANMAISRIAILKNQHRARCSLARADVLQLLNLGYQQRAHLRVEIVIKENNMLDALGMIEDDCCLLIERVALLQINKECPGEVKEAISSLIFAASRCGEFPELQEIRRIFELKFGKEFASSAVDLRNNCGVSPKMIQKFSTRQPSAETKLKVVKEIASENGITLQLEEEPTLIIKKKLNQKMEAKKSADLDNPEIINTTDNLHKVIISDESASESVRENKFKDIASAAQEAFESAAYAALAAKAAIELARPESQDIDKDYEDEDDSQKNEEASGMDSSHESKLNIEEASIASSKIGHSDDFTFERIRPVELESCSSECEDEDMAESNREESPEDPVKESMSSVPNLVSDIRNLKEQTLNPNSNFHIEPENDKLIISKVEGVACKNESSDEDIRAHELK